MEISKDKLETLYETMSLEEMATHLNVAKSTLYYHMRKLGIKRRTKSDAQKRHLDNGHHQRDGKKHSDSSKKKISESTRKFWDSVDGQQQKTELSNSRLKEWSKITIDQKQLIIKRLQSGDRPGPGELSKFGKVLFSFLQSRENVKNGIKITPSHISDLVIEDKKVVIELLMPISIYGEEQRLKLLDRYNRLVQEINDCGYRVFIIEDKSNSISTARCSRVYEELLTFFKDVNLRSTKIVS